MGKPLLRKIAEEVLGTEEAKRIWSRVEIIGDIAVIRRPFSYPIERLRLLASEILRRLPYVKSVWCAVSEVKGEYRLRDFIHLAGEVRSTTIYKEHGCLFKVDITKVYISPALNYEHIRVAKLVREGEYIVNMFAGVGLFSIIIAKHAKPSKVISIDINPDAYKLMVESIRLNKVEGVVIPELGDAAEVSRKYFSMADRVLMPLPELAYRYFEIAVKLLRNEGFIHVYEFQRAMNKDEAVALVSKKYLELSSKLGMESKVEYARIVRSVGPRKYQVVLDMYLRKRT